MADPFAPSRRPATATAAAPGAPRPAVARLDAMLDSLRRIPAETRFSFRVRGQRYQAEVSGLDAAGRRRLRLWSVVRAIPFSVEDPGHRARLLRALEAMPEDRFPLCALYRHNQLLVMDEIALEEGVDDPRDVLALSAVSLQRIDRTLAPLR